MVKPELKIGDIYKVVDSSCIFYVVSGKFILNKCEFKFKHPDLVVKDYVTATNYESVYGKAVRILDIGIDKDRKMALLAIVETIDSPIYLKFFIRFRLGLKFLNDDGRRLKGYLSGEQVIEKIPDVYVGEDLIEAIILKNPLDLQYINPNLLSAEHYKRILLKDGGLLGLIPKERRTVDLCKIAIDNEDYAKRFIPEKIKSLVKS